MVLLDKEGYWVLCLGAYIYKLQNWGALVCMLGKKFFLVHCDANLTSGSSWKNQLFISVCDLPDCCHMCIQSTCIADSSLVWIWEVQAILSSIVMFYRCAYTSAVTRRGSSGSSSQCEPAKDKCIRCIQLFSSHCYAALHVFQKMKLQLWYFL